jgi:hypothetical protein
VVGLLVEAKTVHHQKQGPHLTRFLSTCSFNIRTEEDSLLWGSESCPQAICMARA